MSRRTDNISEQTRSALNSLSRREFLHALRRYSSILPFSALAPGLTSLDLLQKQSIATKSGRPAIAGFVFHDVAKEAGLGAAVNVFGGVDRKQYILEETGCGVALFDYDNDGWLDIFMVNGTRLEGISPTQAPTNFLFHNNR